MSQFLEASMLICFGLSWPINVYKNIKAKTAKSMSLQFILLIIVGYLSGIAAKLITHNVNYVLAVYLLNLAIVSVNVLVYFRNRHYDKAKENNENEGNTESEETAMDTNASEKNRVLFPDPVIAKLIERYKALNQSANPNGIVFLGTDLWKSIHFNELAQSHYPDESFYNRSIPGLRIELAADAVEEVVADLCPSKIFLNFGEVDLQSESFHPDTFIEHYRWILYLLHRISKAKLYIVPVISDAPMTEVLNKRLAQLSDETGCVFTEIKEAEHQGSIDGTVFHSLRGYMRSHSITFTDAMQA